MKRLLLSLALVVLAACASPAAVPWKTFSEAKGDIVDTSPAMCPGGPVFVIQLKHGNDGYRVFYSPDTYRILVLFFKNDADGPPAWLGVGTVDLKQPDVIPPLTRYTMDEAKAKWSSPCAALAPEKA